MKKIVKVEGKVFGAYQECVLALEFDKLELLSPAEEIERFNKEMENEVMPIGGTYYPNKNSFLNGLGILRRKIFDQRPIPSVIQGAEHVEDIPYDGEVIY